MKTQTTLCVVLLLAAFLLQPSSADNTKATSAHDQAATAPSGTRASATGIVKTIDVTAGKIAIAHGPVPVPVLKWPAMTMTFKATPTQVAAVHVGQKVEFEFVSRGMDATLMGISPLK